MDIKSLCTVIPKDDGLLATIYFLEKRAIDDPPPSTRLRLAELVLLALMLLHLMVNTINKRWSGYGNQNGPSYQACVSWDTWKNKYANSTLDLNLNSTNEVVGAASCKREQWDFFILFVFTFHPAIQFTHIVTETPVSFLDVQLSIQDNKISTNVHYKETNTHNYPHNNSSHPHHCRASLPFSQFLGYVDSVLVMPSFCQDCKKWNNSLQNVGIPLRNVITISHESCQ